MAALHTPVTRETLLGFRMDDAGKPRDTNATKRVALWAACSLLPSASPADARVEAVLRDVVTRFELRDARIRRRRPQLVRLQAEDLAPAIAVLAAAELRDEISRLDEKLRRRGQGVVVRVTVAPTLAQARRLRKKAGVNEVVLHADIQKLVRRFVIGGTSVDGGFRLHGVTASKSDRRTASRGPLKLGAEALAAVGGLAALAGWIAVIGGTTMWARFHAAGIPAAEGVAVIPRGELITQGLRTLVMPLIVAVVAVTVLQLALTSSGRNTRERAFERSKPAQKLMPKLARIAPYAGVLIVALALFASVIWFVALASPWGFWIPAAVASPALLAVVIAGQQHRIRDFGGNVLNIAAVVGALALLDSAAWLLTVVEFGWWIAIVIIAALGIFALFRLVSTATTLTHPPRLLPVAIFALVAIWSGVVLTLREAGSKDPRLEVALIFRNKRLAPISGLFLYRVDNAVFVGARRSAGCGIVMVPVVDVERVLIGSNAEDKSSFRKDTCQAAERHGGPAPHTVTRTITFPGATTTLAGSTATTTLAGSTATTTLAGSTASTTETVVAPEGLVITSHQFKRVDKRFVAARFRIVDQNGDPVRGVLVYVLAVRYANVPLAWAESSDRGLASVFLDLQRLHVAKRGRRVIVVVRARRAAGSPLPGVKGVFQFRVPPLH